MGVKGAASIQPCPLSPHPARALGPAGGEDQPHKGQGDSLGSWTATQRTRGRTPASHWGCYPVTSSIQPRKQVTFETRCPGGEDAWSPCLAERLRKADRRRRPISSGRARSPGRASSLPSLPPVPGDRGQARGHRAGPASAVGGGVLPQPPASRGRSSASRKHPGAARGRRKARGGSGI